ncbi:uncharacterized protein LOC131216259 [Anopheles bellator]|uniref:uncharacterized protein LOC131216259 n=1 Tax=Anopheles bellator TaxID=139047 RepID=UPI002649D568|nr:uncharacterized protein LOC131216259 [Anopheles bellator]
MGSKYVSTSTKPVEDAKSANNTVTSPDNKEWNKDLAKLLATMQNQQETMAKCLEQLTISPFVKKGRENSILSKLENSVPSFRYNDASEDTFDKWFFENRDVFEDGDAVHLDDRAKVRLLLSKLNAANCQTYKDSIEPKLFVEVTFKETVSKLMSLFGKTKSCTARRLQFLQMIKKEDEPLNGYLARINRACFDAETSDLTTEQLKCLIFLSGLQSKEDAELRKWLTEKLDKSNFNLTVTDLVTLSDKFAHRKTAATTSPWQEVYVTFAVTEGLFHVILMDSCSFWPEVLDTSDLTAGSIVKCLDTVFARLGQPDVLISCDGTQFESKMFKAYCAEKGIKHRRCYMWPSTNRIEQFKIKLRTTVMDAPVDLADVQKAVTDMLVQYRSSPHQDIPGNKSPAELFFGRRMRMAPSDDLHDFVEVLPCVLSCYT